MSGGLTGPGARRRLVAVGPVVALVAAVVWWGRVASAGALTVAAGVLLGVGIVAVVVGVAVRRRAKQPGR